MLGSSDLEGQIKNIRLTLNQLKLQEQRQKNLEKMRRCTGTRDTRGLAVIIILF